MVMFRYEANTEQGSKNFIRQMLQHLTPFKRDVFLRNVSFYFPIDNTFIHITSLKSLPYTR